MKLRKNFSAESKTVEAMWDTCMNGCSCSLVSCICGTEFGVMSTTNTATQSSYKASIKGGAF